jgi:biofilm PGA synthesis N-glycosyltransferase PgaC
VLLTNFLYQLVLPFLVILSLAVLVIQHNFLYLSIYLSMVYLAYLLISLWMYLAYLHYIGGGLLKMQKKDHPLILFIFPIAALFVRVWSGWAILNQHISQFHLSTSMSPYWVIKRANTFKKKTRHDARRSS